MMKKVIKKEELFEIHEVLFDGLVEEFLNINGRYDLFSKLHDKSSTFYNLYYNSALRNTQKIINGRLIDDDMKLAILRYGDRANSFIAGIGEVSQTLAMSITDKIIDVVMSGIVSDSSMNGVKEKIRATLVSEDEKISKYFAETCRLLENNMVLWDGEDNKSTRYTISAKEGACVKCDELSGEEFDIDKAEPGVNLPPFHPNCRCTVEIVSAESLNEEETYVFDDLINNVDDIPQEREVNPAENNRTTGSGAPIESDTSSDVQIRSLEPQRETWEWLFAHDDYSSMYGEQTNESGAPDIQKEMNKVETFKPFSFLEPAPVNVVDKNEQIRSLGPKMEAWEWSFEHDDYSSMYGEQTSGSGAPDISKEMNKIETFKPFSFLEPAPVNAVDKNEQIRSLGPKMEAWEWSFEHDDYSSMYGEQTSGSGAPDISKEMNKIETFKPFSFLEPAPVNVVDKNVQLKSDNTSAIERWYEDVAFNTLKRAEKSIPSILYFTPAGTSARTFIGIARKSLRDNRPARRIAAESSSRATIEAIDAAQMAEQIYKADMPENTDDSPTVGDWVLIDVWWGVDSMKAGVYVRRVDEKADNPAEYVIVFKGTDNWPNWVNNFLAVTSNASPDMWESIERAVDFSRLHEDVPITFVGHSKGGGEVIAAALATGRNAITFNAANFSFDNYGSPDEHDGRMLNFYVKGDALHSTLGPVRHGEIIMLPTQSWLSIEIQTITGRKSIRYAPDPIENHSIETIIKILKRS